MWAQIINTILGIWIMTSPYILKFEDNKIADFNFITGPLIVTFSIISYAQVSRSISKGNAVIALFLIIVSFFAADTPALFSNLISSLLIILFSFVKGKITDKFGGGWISLFQKNPDHIKHAVKDY